MSLYGDHARHKRTMVGGPSLHDAGRCEVDGNDWPCEVAELVALIERVEKACPVCGGDGWTVEGDNDDPTGPGVQVPCWDAEHAVILAELGV